MESVLTCKCVDYISVCVDWGVGVGTAVVTGATKRDKQKRPFRKSDRHHNDAHVQSATIILCSLTCFCFNAVTASSNSSIIALNKTWTPNNSHIKKSNPWGRRRLVEGGSHHLLAILQWRCDIWQAWRYYVERQANWDKVWSTRSLL